MAKTWFKHTKELRESLLDFYREGDFVTPAIGLEILSQLCGKDSDTLELDVVSLALSLNLKLSTVVHSLEKMHSTGWLTTDVQHLKGKAKRELRLGNSNRTAVVRYSNYVELLNSNTQIKNIEYRDKNKEKEKELELNDQQVDLEQKVGTKKTNFTEEILQAYQDYPRKIGKSKGVKKATSQVKSQQDLTEFKQAITHYRDFVKNQNIAPEFVKHFSTFVGEWRDWVSPDPTTLSPTPAEAPPHAEPLRKIWAEGLPSHVMRLAVNASQSVSFEAFRDWVNVVINSRALDDCDLNSEKLKGYLFAAMREKFGGVSVAA